MGTPPFVLAAVGDVMIDRDDPLSILTDEIRDVLASADVRFGVLETAYSDKGSRGSSGPRGALPHDPKNYVVIPDAGFNVITIAGNHMMDWGEDALVDCIERLKRDNIEPVGAGRNIEEARRPVIIERNGTRIGFLSYCSVAPKGYYAAEGKAGVAPMRAITHYEPFEEDQPGMPCEILTFPVNQDLQRLQADIAALRTRVDLLAVSLHWGIHHLTATLADYQPVVGRAAIDAGADIIIGHHPHKLKGAEVYKGKVILYSIGEFLFDRTPRPKDLEWEERKLKVYRKHYGADEGDARAWFSPNSDAKYTVIARIHVEDHKVARVGFIPVIINESRQPIPYHPSSDQGKEVLAYLRDITRQVDLPTEYEPDGEEIIVKV